MDISLCKIDVRETENTVVLKLLAGETELQLLFQRAVFVYCKMPLKLSMISFSMSINYKSQFEGNFHSGMGSQALPVTQFDGEETALIWDILKSFQSLCAWWPGIWYHVSVGHARGFGIGSRFEGNFHSGMGSQSHSVTQFDGEEVNFHSGMGSQSHSVTQFDGEEVNFHSGMGSQSGFIKHSWLTVSTDF